MAAIRALPGVKEVRVEMTAQVAQQGPRGPARIEPGDVLVTAYTTPAYNVVMSILGGVVTLIGTSTNLVVSDVLARAGEDELGVFEITVVGLPVVSSRPSLACSPDLDGFVGRSPQPR